MKSSQWAIAAVVLAGMVGILTFASNYLGGNRASVGGGQVTNKIPPSLSFPQGLLYPPSGGPIETEDRKGGLDLLGFGSVLGVEHAANYPLVNTKAAAQLGVTDALIAHREVKREFRRQPERDRDHTLAPLRR